MKKKAECEASGCYELQYKALSYPDFKVYYCRDHYEFFTTEHDYPAAMFEEWVRDHKGSWPRGLMARIRRQKKEGR